MEGTGSFFLITFLEIFVQPNFGQNFEWLDPPNSRDREPGSTRGNHFAHSFLLRFSLPSSCLNSAFRIDISGCLRTVCELARKRRKRKESFDDSSQLKTSEKTPMPAITRLLPRLDLLVIITRIPLPLSSNCDRLKFIQEH